MSDRKNYYQIRKDIEKFKNIGRECEAEGNEAHPTPPLSSGSKQLGSESEIAFHDCSNIDIHSDSDDSHSIADDIQLELAISEECVNVSSARLGQDDDNSSGTEAASATGTSSMLEQPGDMHECTNDPSPGTSTSRSDQFVLSLDLRSWYLENNVNLSSFKNLLAVLNKYHNELPLDPRTILKSSASFEVENLSDGQFVYFGIEQNIRKCHSNFILKHKLTVIMLDLNVDGVPVYKSGRKTFWPILCNISNSMKFRSGTSCVFLVGLYLGKSKPPIHEFLTKLILEINHLLGNGLLICDEHYDVKLRSIIADAPARSLLRQTRGHGAYFGCDRCQVKGRYANGSMSYDDLCAPKRTLGAFATQRHAIYHKGVSPLVDVSNLDIIADLPIDYMHCVTIGVMKRLLNLWTCKVPFKLSNNQKTEVNSVILGKIRKYIPKEFNRLPRSLDEAPDFKATEYRTLLLYTGCIIFSDILPTEYFKNFLLLMFAFRILCSAKYVKESNFVDYAEELLIYFVKQYRQLYRGNIVYNIHNLIHIADDARKFGCLDSISAFPFETMNGMIKRKVRTGNLPLQQVINRVKEGAFICTTGEAKKKSGCLSSFSINDFIIIPGQIKNSCVILKTGDIGIVTKSNDTLITFRKFRKRTPAFMHPCDSSLVGVYLVYNGVKEVQVSRAEIEGKCVICPFKGKYIAMCLL